MKKTFKAESLPVLMNDFLVYLGLAEGLSANTIAAYKRDLNLFQKWLVVFNKVGLDCITQQDVEDFMFYLHSEGRKEKSNARFLSTLKRFYQWGASNEHFASDPTALVKGPTIPKSIPKVITEEQVEKLLFAPDEYTPLGIRDRAILELMYASGLRVSELVGLPFEQLNLSAGLVQVTGKGNKERIEMLEYIQGHRLTTILNHYNIYNIKDCLIDDTDDEDNDDETE